MSLNVLGARQFLQRVWDDTQELVSRDEKRKDAKSQTRAPQGEQGWEPGKEIWESEDESAGARPQKKRGGPGRVLQRGDDVCCGCAFQCNITMWLHRDFGAVLLC